MIHIGVTGHRFLADLPALQAGIDQALARIAQAYPGQGWTLVSALAEGADRLVIRRAWRMQPGARLVVCLPLEVPDYLLDFSSQEAQTEFTCLLAQATEIIPAPGPGGSTSGPGPGSQRSQGYERAGLALLDRSDVLVALWDGQPERGQGGTGAMVRLARQRGLPLAWVRCGNGRPDSQGEEHGRVSFERMGGSFFLPFL